jgi:hypothetical protein
MGLLRWFGIAILSKVVARIGKTIPATLVLSGQHPGKPYRRILAIDGLWCYLK